MEVPEAQIDAAFAARDLESPDTEKVDADFQVWPENEPALAAFLALATQWHFHPQSGRPAGLNYTAVRQVIRAQRSRFSGVAADAVFLDVLVMERAALVEMRTVEA